MNWYWCIAKAPYAKKISTYRFEAESLEDANVKATEWWKQENDGLKSDFFAVAVELHYHERKIDDQPHQKQKPANYIHLREISGED